jgi:hypothetical protein
LSWGILCSLLGESGVRALRLFLALVVLMTAATALGRTWTDKFGKQTQGKFVRYHEGDVVILRGSKAITIAYDTLSTEDQEYVRKQLEAKGQADLLPAPKAEATGDDSDGRLAVPGVERTWTSNDGKEIRAQLVAISGDKVTLLFKGREVTIRLTRLSEDDQQYVKEEKAKLPKKAAPAATPQPMPVNPTPQPAWSPPMPTRPPNWPQPMQPPQFPQPPAFPQQPPMPMHPTPMIPATPQPQAPSPFTPQAPSPFTPQAPNFAPQNNPGFPQSGMPMGESKICSNCRKVLPSGVGAGDKCPYCGTFFALETDASGRVVKRAPIGKYVALGGLIPAIAVAIGLLFRFLRNS